MVYVSWDIRIIKSRLFYSVGKFFGEKFFLRPLMLLAFVKLNDEKLIINHTSELFVSVGILKT